MAASRLIALALFVVGVWIWSSAVTPPSSELRAPVAVTVEPETVPHSPPPGVDRSSCGCAAETVDAAGPSPADLDQQLEEYATATAGSELEALDFLLFHREQSLERLAHLALDWPEEARRPQLQRELQRTHTWVALRIIDEQGVVRTRVAPRLVPFGLKQHLKPDSSERLLAAEFSGRVERVGLNHLWARY